MDLFPLGSSGIKFRTKRGATWVEDSFVRHSSPIDETHEYVASSLTPTLYRIAQIFLVGILVVLFARVGYLQIINGSFYGIAAQSNRSRHIPIAAQRGIISDRFGEPLVHNVPKFSLHILPYLIPKDEALRRDFAGLIASILLKSQDEVLGAVKDAAGSADRELILYDNISPSQAIMLSVRASSIPALQVVSGIKRSYVTNETALESLSHIIGYEGKITREEYVDRRSFGYQPTDYIGKQGIEAGYETLLRGQKGDKVIEVNATGVGLSTLSETAPVSGSEIKLSIDLELQKVAEDALKNTMRINGKDRGSVIVEDVGSGAILALVSLPGYDNEAFSHGIKTEEFKKILDDPRHPLISRAISGLYPSGSVIKPIYALAGLEEEVITKDTTVLSTGGLQVGKWFFPDWKAGGHGVVNVKDAIANSVNTFFYILGGGFEGAQGLGVDRLEKWLNIFGFGGKLGIDIPAEAAGFIPSPSWEQERKGEQWYIGDTYNLSIGQGDLLISPLQIVNAIATIANGGTRYVPHLLLASKSSSDSDFNRKEAQIAGHIPALNEYFKIVQEGMRETVLAGSARSLQGISVNVAGKTGTAQSVAGKASHAWFTGFAPYEKPEIALVVLVDEGGEGSHVAVPVAKEIFDWWGKVGSARFHSEKN